MSGKEAKLINVFGRYFNILSDAVWCLQRRFVSFFTTSSIPNCTAALIQWKIVKDKQ